MSFKGPSRRLLIDIVEAIAMIEQFTAGIDLEDFRSNPMAVAAVERKLLIVSEAAIRMGEEAERLFPINPGATFAASATISAMPMSASTWLPSGLRSRKTCRRSKLL